MNERVVIRRREGSFCAGADQGGGGSGKEERSSPFSNYFTNSSGVDRVSPKVLRQFLFPPQRQVFLNRAKSALALAVHQLW